LKTKGKIVRAFAAHNGAVETASPGEQFVLKPKIEVFDPNGGDVGTTEILIGDGAVDERELPLCEKLRKRRNFFG
jgi:hypothetical protein